MLTGALAAAFAGAMMKAGTSNEAVASAASAALVQLISRNLLNPACATTLAALTAAGFAVVVAGNGGLPVFRSQKDGSIATVLSLPRA